MFRAGAVGDFKGESDCPSRARRQQLEEQEVLRSDTGSESEEGSSADLDLFSRTDDNKGEDLDLSTSYELYFKLKP